MQCDFQSRLIFPDRQVGCRYRVRDRQREAEYLATTNWEPVTPTATSIALHLEECTDLLKKRSHILDAVIAFNELLRVTAEANVAGDVVSFECLVEHLHASVFFIQTFLGHCICDRCL